jgi:EpsI family protein
MSDTSNQSLPPAPPGPVASRGPSAVQLGIVVAILAGGIILTALTADVTRVSEPGVRLVDGKPFLEPQVGGWRGGVLQGLTEDERRLLPADTEGARRLYVNAAGHEIYCSVVVAGREVTSIHRPELCLPGQGWEIQNEYTEAIPVPTASGGALKVMRMNSTRSALLTNGKVVRANSVFFYWFVGKDRVTPYHWQRILWTTKDRVLHNTNHRWAYILVHIPVGIESPDTPRLTNAAMLAARDFVQAIYPTLMLP